MISDWFVPDMTEAYSALAAAATAAVPDVEILLHVLETSASSGALAFVPSLVGLSTQNHLAALQDSIALSQAQTVHLLGEMVESVAAGVLQSFTAATATSQ